MKETFGVDLEDYQVEISSGLQPIIINKCSIFINQFDHLSKRGYKLNLVTFQYYKA